VVVVVVVMVIGLVVVVVGLVNWGIYMGFERFLDMAGVFRILVFGVFFGIGVFWEWGFFGEWDMA